jgi:hypothetical protein
VLTAAVVRNRDWVKLLTGQLVSQVCDRMMTLGLVWIITTRMSVSWVPWFLAAGALPHLALGWKAGEVASRWGALNTVVWTDLARGALFLVATFGWPAFQGDGLLPALFVLTLISNSASALFNPAMFSLPASLADEQE